MFEVSLGNRSSQTNMAPIMHKSLSASKMIEQPPETLSQQHMNMIGDKYKNYVPYTQRQKHYNELTKKPLFLLSSRKNVGFDTQKIRSD